MTNSTHIGMHDIGVSCRCRLSNVDVQLTNTKKFSKWHCPNTDESYVGCIRRFHCLPRQYNAIEVEKSPYEARWHGIAFLVSALNLNFPGLLGEPPLAWLAIDRKARRSTIEGLPLRVVRFSDVSLRTGVELHVIESVSIPVTNPVKTVVDWVKYRGIRVDAAWMRYAVV